MSKRPATARYLLDKATGRTFGWNPEMAKLPNMVEVDDPKRREPDPTLAEARPARALTIEISSEQLAADAKATEAEAVARAAKAGETQLDNDPPEFDDDGHQFLGYDEDGEPVYETDEERDARLIDEEQPPPEDVGDDGKEPEPTPPRKRKGK